MKGFEYVERFLQNEGFRFSKEDNYISFKFEGTTYVTFKNDSNYVEIMLICDTDDIDRLTLLETCNGLNQEKFALKFSVQDNTVWCSYEFIPSEQTSNDDFCAILTMLWKASDELFALLNGKTEQ